ncbi:MAG TPA: AtpZ/AtpI family protein [Egibacteraceae bacterium]|nr:AtpZ/AtpI family protein [Egibacteraceae bacterium]
MSEQRALWASDMNRAAFHSADLFAAILAWGGIGWLLDRWLGTAPWLMVTGFLIGNALGLYLAWLRGSGTGSDAVTKQEGTPGASE